MLSSSSLSLLSATVAASAFFLSAISLLRRCPPDVPPSSKFSRHNIKFCRMVTNLGEEKQEKRVLHEGPVLQKKTIARCRAVRHLDNLEIMRQNWEVNGKNITEEILRIYMPGRLNSRSTDAIARWAILNLAVAR